MGLPSFLLCASVSVHDSPVSAHQVLSTCGVNGSDQDGCACLRAPTALGDIARSFGLSFLFVPSCCTHSVQLALPQLFPKRAKRSKVWKPQLPAPRPSDLSLKDHLGNFRQWATELLERMEGEHDSAGRLPREKKGLESFAFFLETKLHHELRLFDLRSQCPGGFKYTPSTILHSMLLSSNLKDVSSMREVLNNALGLLATPQESERLKDTLKSAQIPHRTTLSRFRLRMDVARMMKMGRLHKETGHKCARFIMSGSSPQHGDHIMLSCVLQLTFANLKAATDAMGQLVHVTTFLWMNGQKRTSISSSRSPSH